MILNAISGVRRSIDKEKRGEGEDRMIVTHPGTDSTGARHATHLGPASPNDLRHEPNMSLVTSTGLGLGRESAGDILRPWLFGNWWILGDLSDQTPQLIGIGARLAKTPRIHDAEGNPKEKVIYRGSALRIRTDDRSFSPGK
jgi:hypothetical protein